ncbi:MAG: 16S rRNA (cytosine(1402)-N(4))-methyltransferase RsmH [Puniceicoccales bacterium]|jgi:16S rRNA (cytosine1402-N4)-methyltransferase|nr:16S rRNA (cytosine(1402)-N(4))-methyltransferase RsmH [Puniceicoccales bacterium]
MIGEAQSLPTHCPVLSAEVVKWLNPSAGGQFLDCTFGGGGHGEALFSAAENIFIYAIDCDPNAKQRAQEFSLRHANFRFYQINFSEADCLRLAPLNGILMDLGVSSFQLDEESRGFSFRHHVPMDMRMDPGKGISAREFLQTANESDLVTAIREYGEEEHWKKIVKTIAVNRKNPDICYADTFAKLIASCSPKGMHRKIHPATKTFQGLRIFINDELRALQTALPIMFDKLAIGGRLAVISFHSLEDRIVKKFFNQMAGKSIDRFDSNSQQDRIAYGKILTRNPIIPSAGEIIANPRSRSAKLRVLEKIKSRAGEK